MSIASDKAEAELWARQIMSKPAGQVLILDTETCALNGEIIELGIINTAGDVVYNGRFNPLTNIDPGAYRVHGISHLMLMEEPRFADEYSRVRVILSNAKTVLIYNAPFDVRCLEETCRVHELAPVTFKAECIMRWYAKWYGEVGSRGYKWQQLAGGDHSAVGDAKAALDLLRRMAGVRVTA